MTCRNNTTDASTLLRARAKALRATDMRGCATIGEWNAAYQQAENFDIAADWLEQQLAAPQGNYARSGVGDTSFLLRQPEADRLCAALKP